MRGDLGYFLGGGGMGRLYDILYFSSAQNYGISRCRLYIHRGTDLAILGRTVIGVEKSEVGS